MSFEANTRRAIASYILVCYRYIMHITVAYDFIYYRASREADMISASYSKCLHNTGVLARRHSWWWCWREVYRKWYSTAMWVVIEVGSGPREILSGRIFVRAPNKMGRIFADIMRPSVLPTVEFDTTHLGWYWTIWQSSPTYELVPIWVVFAPMTVKARRS